MSSVVVQRGITMYRFYRHEENNDNDYEIAELEMGPRGWKLWTTSGMTTKELGELCSYLSEIARRSTI